MQREIIYVNATAFAVQIEKIKNRSLKDFPIVIAPGGSRSQVLALSYEARQAGLRKGMPLKDAMRQCRRVIVLPPDEGLYLRATREMNKILSGLSPVFESEKYGHTFLDVTSTQKIFGGAKEAAWKAHKEIAARLRIDTSVGLGANKLVSKVAASAIRPKGFQDVFPGTEEQFMAPLHVGFLPEVNRAIQEQLLELNIKINRELAAISLVPLSMLFGRTAVLLSQHAHGQDNRPVQPRDTAPFVLEKQTLGEDTNDLAVLSASLYVLVEKASLRLRKQMLHPGKLGLRIRYADYKEEHGQIKLAIQSNGAHALYPCAERLLKRILVRRTRVRFLSLQFMDLRPVSSQLSLFPDIPHPQTASLTQAIDQIRDQFGEASIRYARGL
ncbi:MAG: hypothetical protein V1800_17485 [Candidatus Latescibacterota bacterium]